MSGTLSPNRLLREGKFYGWSNHKGTGTMRFHIMVAIVSIVTLSFTASAAAQGVPGGVAHGVSVGNQLPDR